MPNVLYQVFKGLSILLFFYYGLSVLASNAMVGEFERFGMDKLRTLTGSLEVLGAAGLLAGYFIFVPALVVAASAGLTLLMIGGVAVRFRAGDSLADATPALIMLLMNLYICVYATGLLLHRT